MGAFFTNIQLSTAEVDKSNITDKVVDFLIKRNAEAGFIKIDSEEDADKSVIITTSQDLTWISIYYEETEDQNSKKLNKLASELSKEFKTNALSILVNDSDTVYVGITNNGTLKDSINNRSKKIDFSKSKPLVWTNILVNNYSFEDIKNAWQKEMVFVEEFLTRFSKLIHLDSSKLLTGYEYFNEESLTGKIKLNFAEKNKKKAPALGLTKFSMVAGSGLVNAKNSEKQFLDWIITNEGDSSKGLEIIVKGGCLENGCIIPELANVSLFIPQADQQNDFTTTFMETVSTNGEKLFYARVEDIIIPKGYNPTFPLTPKESKRYLDIRYNRSIRCNISFIALNKEVGEFTIFFCPLVNRQEGTYADKVFKGQLDDWLKKNE